MRKISSININLFISLIKEIRMLSFSSYTDGRYYFFYSYEASFNILQQLRHIKEDVIFYYLLESLSLISTVKRCLDDKSFST